MGEEEERIRKEKKKEGAVSLSILCI